MILNVTAQQSLASLQVRSSERPDRKRNVQFRFVISLSAAHVHRTHFLQFPALSPQTRHFIHFHCRKVVLLTLKQRETERLSC